MGNKVKCIRDYYSKCLVLNVKPVDYSTLMYNTICLPVECIYSFIKVHKDFNSCWVLINASNINKQT